MNSTVRILALSLAIVAVTLVGGCGSSSEPTATTAAEKPVYRFTMATPFEAGHPSVIADVHWAEFVSANCETEDGRVIIERKFGPESIAAKDQLGAVKSGTVDVAEIVTNYVQGEIPEFKLLMAPGVWTPTNWRELWNNGAKDILAEGLKRHGLVLLHQPNVNPTIVFTTDPFSSLMDLKGRVIRGTGKPFTDFLAYVGASAENLETAEVYTGLERGVIDGSMQGSTSYTQYGFWDVAPYVLDYDFNAILALDVMNAEKFNSLPKSLQEKLLELGVQHEEWVENYWLGVIQDVRDQMKEHGVTMISVPKEEIVAMESYVTKVYSKQVGAEIPEAQAAFEQVVQKVGKE